MQSALGKIVEALEVEKREDKSKAIVFDRPEELDSSPVSDYWETREDTYAETGDFERPKDDLPEPIPDEYDENEKSTEKGLTDEEKQKIKEDTGWSEETIDAIGSMKEYEIYKKAGLVEGEISGKMCLVRPDIDMEQKDEFGRTNQERMEDGKPPITKGGETIELHHIGQKSDSPLAELTMQEHRGKGNDDVLHDKQKESEIDRNAFGKEREEHWEERAKQS